MSNQLEIVWKFIVFGGVGVRNLSEMESQLEIIPKFMFFGRVCAGNLRKGKTNVKLYQNKYFFMSFFWVELVLEISEKINK